jgi:ankyrin repeat protein/tRNA A-37 threonylcarbamoyl transferase component Bud32
MEKDKAKRAETRFNMVQYLVEQGKADVNALGGKNQSTPLHEAVSGDWWVCSKEVQNKIVRYLVKEGKANVNAKNKAGETPLHMAARWSKPDVVEYLVEQGKADVNAKDENWRTPLHMAALADSSEIVKYLLGKGANVNIENKDGKTPLHMAASASNRIETVKCLVEEGKADINAKDIYMRTPLDIAEGAHLREISTYLTQIGKANNNQITFTTRPQTPTVRPNKEQLNKELLEAAKKGDSKQVQLLLRSGADVNAKTKDVSGFTTLSFAARKGQLHLVKYLVENYKVDVSNGYDGVATPMNMACNNGHLKIVEYLVEKCGADVNAKDSTGNIPLHWAAFEGKLNVVRYLVEKNRANNINAKDDNGQTPLHLAISGRGQLDVVQYLVGKGANVNAKNKKRETPLHAATEKSKLDVVQYLVEVCKVDVNIKNNSGKAPLDRVPRHGYSRNKVFDYLSALNQKVKTNEPANTHKSSLDNNPMIYSQMIKSTVPSSTHVPPLDNDSVIYSQMVSKSTVPSSAHISSLDNNSVLNSQIMPKSTAQPSSSPSSLKTISRSELTFGKKIGQGAFGKVNIGFYQGQVVALKQMKGAQLPEKAVKEFKQEASILSKLNSPNIVGFKGVHIEDFKVVIVMEYCAGGTVYHQLHSEQDLHWDRRWNWITGFAKGVSYLHDNKIVHRDLAARNILLDSQDNPKISDFGLSRTKTYYTNSSTSTSKAFPLAWTSPELLLGDKPKATYASDMYSVGIVVLEIASRKNPLEEFADSHHQTIINKVTQENYRDPIPEDAPPVVKEIIEVCTRTQPEKRPSAEQLVRYSALFSVSKAEQPEIPFDQFAANEKSLQQGSVNLSKNY